MTNGNGPMLQVADPAASVNAALDMLPAPSAPMEVARVFVRRRCTFGDAELTLRYKNGGWWCWRTTHWGMLDERVVRAELYAFCENAVYFDGDRFKQWAPTRRKIGDLQEALSAVVIFADDTEAPCWTDGREIDGPVVAMTNGLLSIKTKKLLPHTPSFFNVTSVPFAFDPDAPEPEKWHAFLGEILPHDQAAIDLLSEWFGYIISGRLDLHKILLMIGPTRAGKGVIARVLTALIGRRNVCGPTLNSLGGDFGLAPLLGKSLAVISDARFSGKNSGVVVERLLSISGEDCLTVNVKYKEQVSGKLPCRLHVISNELPRLGDSSGAIVGRFILLPLTRSWLGKENHSLEEELTKELSGILNWALEGLERLTDNDKFSRVDSADEALIHMHDLSSPCSAFVRERCKLDASKSIEVDVLYNAYRNWSTDNEVPKCSKQVFGRDLRASTPSLRIEQRGPQGARVRHYAGIALLP